jgi:hypothetical protein
MKSLLALSLVAGCTTSISSGHDLGTPDNPLPENGDQDPYLVTSNVDLSVEAVLPAQAEAVVATLREFSMNPAHALIDLATRAGVPAIGQIYGVIPSVLTNQLEGWINGEINKIQVGGKPITEWAGDMAALFDTALTKFNVASTLAVNDTMATHTLTSIDFSPSGIDFQVSLAGLPNIVVTQQTSIMVDQGGALALGEQHFGLNYGDFAWTAVNSEITTLFGGDLRTTIGKAVNCTNVAHVVASKCVLAACVGHESQLDQICEGGLDELVNQLHSQMQSFNQDAFEVASGTGKLVDDNADGIGDRITGGTWDAQMNLGMGLRHTPATFTATRKNAPPPPIQ